MATIEDHLTWIRQKSANAEAAAEHKASEQPAQLYLPGFDDVGALPNHLNRSSLIAPVARGPRKHHMQTVMVTRRDCVLEYTGQQLDESDGDLIMALIFFAKPFPLGTPVPLKRAELLRKLERGTGKSQYDWLYRSMKRLREGTMFLEARKPDGSTRYSVGKMLSFSILKELDYDSTTKKYSYILDPRWVILFSNQEYALIDWDKRMQIGRGQDMAKTLQRLVATSSNPVQYYALEWLKEKMEYAGRMRDFEDAITHAVTELVRLEIVARGSIDDSAKGKPQLVLWLKPSA